MRFNYPLQGVDPKDRYSNKLLIATHTISDKIINYAEEHYREGFANKGLKDDKIEQYTKEEAQWLINELIDFRYKKRPFGFAVRSFFSNFVA